MSPPVFSALKTLAARFLIEETRAFDVLLLDVSTTNLGNVDECVKQFHLVEVLQVNVSLVWKG